MTLLAQLLLAGWLTLSWGSIAGVGDEWKEIRYKGRTSYWVVRDTTGNCLRAEARDQNSALMHVLPIGQRLRRMRWRWRVLRHPDGADPATRRRDDRAAAVLVLVHRNILPWRTRGLLYQWAPAGKPGEWVSSPYARDIRVLTLQRAPAGARWVMEERDLDADFRAAFGRVPVSIEAVGVLCDTDNTGEHAEAEFGEIECEMEPVDPTNPQ